MLKVIEAAKVPIEFDTIENFCFDNQQHRDLLRKNQCIVVGNIGEEKSRYIENTKLYKYLDLYVNVVHLKKLPNVVTRHKQPIDIVIVRENLEGEYSGIEHEVYPGVFESLKIITKEKTQRLARYAFENAFLNGRKKITVVHKANIMKMVDGLFLECCREEAKRFPQIQYEEMIVDNTSMQLVKSPEQFDVMLTPNLYGSIITSACAGLIGGAGVTAGASFGKEHMFFEPGTRKSGISLAGKDLANPTPMLLTSVNMLRQMGLPRFGDLIQQAIRNVYAEGKVLTQDVGGKATNTQFTDRVIQEVVELDKGKNF